MKYYLFIDETGDHSLSNIDQNFPIFMIGGVLISEKEYKVFQEKINNFKNTFFGTKEVILHSRNIRKIDPPFQILFDLEVKKRFYNHLDKIILDTDVLWFNYPEQLLSLLNDKNKSYMMAGKNPMLPGPSYMDYGFVELILYS